MAEQIKNIYNHDSLGRVARDIKAVYDPFSVDEFLRAVFNDSWAELALKDRIYHISRTLGDYLPTDYAAALSVVMNYGIWLEGFAGFFPIFIELYGQAEADWDLSMAALARYTPYASAEIAVRAFIINHEERMMAQMRAWAEHEDENVRRLASEGCRPQLPWGLALTSFKRDPTPILPILEQLKQDPSLHVRKSVANNLNDISKTHPELVAKLAQEWYGKHEYTDWIVKHACRTLLKQGHREVLGIFGFGNAAAVQVLDFALDTPAISIGEELTFRFVIRADEPTKVRLEYGVDYVKANGKTSRKIFQISEISLKAGEKKTYAKKQSFADVSVRKHYPGTHTITLIVNGAQQGSLDFMLQ